MPLPCQQPCASLARRNGELTGRQVRSSSAVCNRGLCFQSEAWRRLDLHVAVLKQASAGGWEAGTGVVGDGPLPSPLDDHDALLAELDV